MRIKARSIIYYYVVFICIINLQFLMFRDFTNLFNVFTAGSAVALAGICFYDRQIRRQVKPYIKYVNKYIIVFFSYYAVETIYGLMCSNVEPIEYVKRILPFLYILLVYPLTCLLADKRYRQKIIKMIFVLSIASLVMKTLVWWLFNYKGIDVMHYVLYEEGYIWQRNGLIRIRSSCFDALVISIALRNIIKEKGSKILNIAIIAFLTFYANFVMQSRSLLISIIAAIFLTLIFRRQIGWKKGIIVIILTTIGIYILQSSYFESFVGSFDVYTYSTSIRLQGLAFYLSSIKNHIWLGLIPLNTYESIKGGNWRYFISDLGMMSKFFEYGVFGLIIFNIPFIRCICLNIIKIKGKSSLTLCMLFLTLIFSYLSNDIYITKNILALPLLISIHEVVYRDQLYDMSSPNLARLAVLSKSRVWVRKEKRLDH